MTARIDIPAAQWLDLVSGPDGVMVELNVGEGAAMAVGFFCFVVGFVSPKPRTEAVNDNGEKS